MSNFNENNFDKIFKEKLGNYEEAPPDIVLNNLKAHFSNRPTSILGKILNNKRIFIVSTAVILSIIGVSIYYSCYNNSNTSHSNPLAKILKCNNPITVSDKSNNNALVSNSVNKEINTNNNSDVVKENNIIKSDNIVNFDNSSIIIDTNKRKTQLVLTEKNTQSLNKDILKVNLDDSKPIEISFTIIPSTCKRNNGSITANIISGNNDINYSWSSFGRSYDITTNKLNNLYSGEYRLTVSNNKNEKTYIINVPDSGYIKADFIHSELEQNVSMPIYFTNKTKVANNSSLFGTSYEWNFGDGTTSSETNPQHKYTKEGNYTVTLIAKNSLGCIDTNAISDINIKTTNPEAPNIFSPNGDGINDIFKPKVKPSKSYTCTIINQDGKVIYQWNNPEEGWDGRINNNQAEVGIYFYIINGTDINNNKYIFKGNIMLVR